VVLILALAIAAVARLQQLPQGQVFNPKSGYAAKLVAVRLAGGDV
jgi:hypothetical protein